LESASSSFSKFHVDPRNDIKFGCGLLGARKLRQEIGPDTSHTEGEAVGPLTSAALSGKSERKCFDQHMVSGLSCVEKPRTLNGESNADDASNFVPKGELSANELLEEEINIKIEELRIRQLCSDLAKRRAMSKGLSLSESKFEPVTSPMSRSPRGSFS
jgi:hypothetical protein